MKHSIKQKRGILKIVKNFINDFYFYIFGLFIYLIFIFNFEQSLQEDLRFSGGCVLNKLWITP